MEDADPHSTVTFIHLACSGGRIKYIMVENDLDTIGNNDGICDPGEVCLNDEHGGILTKYAGINPPANTNDFLDPQLDEMLALLGARKADAVLISVGANDLKFSSVIENCILHTECWNHNAEFWHLLTELPSKYDELAAALVAAGVTPDKTFLTQYFDPTHDDFGNLCSGVLGPGFPIGIDGRRDAVGVHEVVTNLNGYGRAGAARNSGTMSTASPADFASTATARSTTGSTRSPSRSCPGRPERRLPSERAWAGGLPQAHRRLAEDQLSADPAEDPAR